MASSNDPRPGRPVRGSDTGRPIMAAFDLLGRRWTLRIIGELGEGPLGFNEAQRRLDGVSSSVLATRLRELAALGIAETDEAGAYRLTRIGTSLLVALAPLWIWSDAWAMTTGSEPNQPPPSGLLEALTGAPPVHVDRTTTAGRKG